MRAAFKEWAVIVDALGRGDQIIILRKGGISEGRGGFKIEHDRFVLFPTLFHQQRESVTPATQIRYDAIAPGLAGPETLRIEYFAEVAAAVQLHSLEAANTLHGQHVWRDEVIADRFDWGREKSIYAIAIRVHRLPQRIDIPMLPAYGGCKSWIELDRDVPVSNATPVLSDADFAEKLGALHRVLASTTAKAQVPSTHA